MSSACGNCQVESQARACYVAQFTYNLFDLGLPMIRYTFVLPSENAFACSPSAQMPFIMKYSHSRTSRRSELFAKVY